MADEQKQVFQRLDAVLKNAVELPLGGGNKYAIMSDIHLGDGGQADNFHRNEQALMTALRYYRRNGHSLILLGDIEELWQFDIDRIVKRYGSSLYRLLRSYEAGRVHRVFGNHDIEWGSPPDPIAREPGRSRGAPEGVRLADGDGTSSIFLLHGHQGTANSDRYAWFSRFVVRAVTPLEWLGRLIGIKGAVNPSHPDSEVPTDFEAIRYLWAKKRRLLLICGHTHRAIFASESWGAELRRKIDDLQAELQTTSSKPRAEKLHRELRERQEQLHEEQERGRDVEVPESRPKPCYFNCGCGLYTSGPTCMEVDSGQICLVKWDKRPVGKATRSVLKEGNIAEFFNSL